MNTILQLKHTSPISSLEKVKLKIENKQSWWKRFQHFSSQAAMTNTSFFIYQTEGNETNRSAKKEKSEAEVSTQACKKLDRKIKKRTISFIDKRREKANSMEIGSLLVK